MKNPISLTTSGVSYGFYECIMSLTCKFVKALFERSLEGPERFKNWSLWKSQSLTNIFKASFPNDSTHNLSVLNPAIWIVQAQIWSKFLEHSTWWNSSVLLDDIDMTPILKIWKWSNGGPLLILEVCSVLDNSHLNVLLKWLSSKNCCCCCCWTQILWHSSFAITSLWQDSSLPCLKNSVLLFLIFF